VISPSELSPDPVPELTAPEECAVGDVDSIRALSDALMDTASVIRIMPGPVRVAPAEELPAEALPALQDLLSQLTRALGLPRIDVVPDSAPLSAAELAVSDRLALRRHGLRTGPERISEAAQRALSAFPGPAVVMPAYDRIPLRCWTAGPQDRPAVVIASACGMPIGLAARWMTALSSSYRVVTWESRGLFAAGAGQGLGPLGGHSLDVQGKDLLAVLDGFGIRQAHAMGICGGAPIALAAAAHPDRITSMSLWHGDYELGSDAPKTIHQQDVASLLAMVSRGRAQAEAMYKLMRRPATLERLRRDIAHYLIHPYASPETLYRYGLLNGAIMSTDCRPLLTASQPALIVTSAKDTTVHPAGSQLVAAHLIRAQLRGVPDGDHLTAFDAEAGLVELALSFLQDLTRRTGKLCN
jgi:3-oxoadipate enol-lactonase